MSAIKPGDLVMLVKPTPCCGDDRGIGRVFVAENPALSLFRCCLCERTNTEFVHLTGIGELGYIQTDRLKKIDPPAIGDSLPTRADLDIPEPACP